MNAADLVPNQALVLADGRSLAWQEVGDLNGPPVFFFHGGNDSRLASDLIARAALEAGVWLIAPDRPGYGRSDFMPGRRLVDWGADVGELADHLGIGRFDVMGHSAGGPHALAVAWVLPGRVERIMVVAGAAPRSAPYAGMAFPFRLNRILATFMPFVLPAFMGNHRRSLDDPKTYLSQWGWASPADGAMFAAQPKVAAMVVAEQVEGYRQGVDGPVLDNKLYYRDWGFDLGEIQKEVNLFYASEDTMAPIGWGEHLRDLLPNATLHVAQGEGHISVLINRATAILRGETA